MSCWSYVSGAKQLAHDSTAAILAPAPATANAIYRAAGVRIRELPITPEKILEGLEEKKDATT